MFYHKSRNCVKIAKTRHKLSAPTKLNSRLLFSADENKLKTAGWSCWRETKLKHRLAERYFLLLRRNFFHNNLHWPLAYTRRVPTSYVARRERSPIGCQLVKNFNIYSRLLKAKIWRLTTTQAATRQCKRCAVVKSAEVQKRVITTSANEIVFTSLPFLLSLRARRSIAGP